MGGVDSIKIIDGQRRKVAGACGSNAVSCRLRLFERSSDIRVVARGACLDFGKWWQQRLRVQILGEFEIVIEVRKYEDRQIETRVDERELRFLQLPSPVIHQQLTLDHIGVRHFTAVL